MKKDIERQHIINELVQIQQQQDPNGNVWRSMYHIRFPFLEKGIRFMDRYSSKDLIDFNIKQPYLITISKASSNTINYPIQFDNDRIYYNDMNEKEEFVEEEDDEEETMYVTNFDGDNTDFSFSVSSKKIDNAKIID